MDDSTTGAIASARTTRVVDPLDALLRPNRPTRLVDRWRELRDRARDIPRRRAVGVLGAAVTGVIVLGIAVLPSISRPPATVSLPRARAGTSGASGAPGAPGGSAAHPGASGSAGDKTSTTELEASRAPVVVHVVGAVLRPGVLHVPTTARWSDAVEAAGGPTADADLERINLAAPVVDGARLFVPRIGSEVPSEIVAEPPPATSGPGGDGDAALAPVDLNTATPDQLDTLPGIGPATASAIIEYRESNGPFDSVDQLLDVAGIGPAKFERLASRVRVGAQR